jgi:hypothetical protein
VRTEAEATAGRPAGAEAGWTARQLARRVLLAFLFTFMAARLVSLLIMSRKIPDLYLHIGGTHVHHLNHGIMLLAVVAGCLLFRRQRGRRLMAVLYGIALALTFDEFGMWLHLGGSYWQRASWDAVCVIAAGLGLFAYGPALARYRPQHWINALLVAALVAGFLYCLTWSLKFAARKVAPRLHQIEQASPE